MARRQAPAGPSAEVAREVLGAVAAVLGSTADAIVAAGAARVPEFILIRHVAACALVKAGWSRLRVARHCHVDSKIITGTGLGPRLRANVPALVDIAERAAAQAIERSNLERDVKAEARAVLLAEATAAGIRVDEAATAPTAVARRVRAKVARRLYDREYDGPQIAEALGYGTTTVYRMLADRSASGRRTC